MDNQESETFEHALNLGFLIGGVVFIVIIGILWFTFLRRNTQQAYPVPQMLGVALAAQVIGVFAFFA